MSRTDETVIKENLKEIFRLSAVMGQSLPRDTIFHKGDGYEPNRIEALKQEILTVFHQDLRSQVVWPLKIIENAGIAAGFVNCFTEQEELFTEALTAAQDACNKIFDLQGMERFTIGITMRSDNDS